MNNTRATHNRPPTQRIGTHAPHTNSHSIAAPYQSHCSPAALTIEIGILVLFPSLSSTPVHRKMVDKRTINNQQGL